MKKKKSLQEDFYEHKIINKYSTNFEDGNLQHHTGIVAIPSDFNLDLYLSLRESCNFFNDPSINVSSLKLMISFIRFQSVWKSFASKKTLNIKTVLHFFQILDDIGLLLDFIYGGQTSSFIIINVLSPELSRKSQLAIQNITDIESND